MKVEVEIPDDARVVPLAIVQYVDAEGRLQCMLSYLDAAVPLMDCLNLAAQNVAEARRKAGQ